RYAELRALHDTTRLQPDRHVAAMLVEVGGHVEGPLARALQAYGGALVDDDARRLETVAMQLAAEAAARAGAAFERAGLVSRAERSFAHARAAASCCEGARTPALE